MAITPDTSQGCESEFDVICADDVVVVEVVDSEGVGGLQLPGGVLAQN